MSKISLQPPPTQTDEFGHQWRTWLFDLFSRVGSGPVAMRGYTVATLPAADNNADNTAGREFSTMIYVVDEVGGATLAFSDGVNWRRVQDRAIVS